MYLVIDMEMVKNQNQLKQKIETILNVSKREQSNTSLEIRQCRKRVTGKVIHCKNECVRNYTLCVQYKTL